MIKFFKSLARWVFGLFTNPNTTLEIVPVVPQLHALSPVFDLYNSPKDIDARILRSAGNYDPYLTEILQRESSGHIPSVLVQSAFVDQKTPQTTIIERFDDPVLLSRFREVAALINQLDDRTDIDVYMRVFDNRRNAITFLKHKARSAADLPLSERRVSDLKLLLDLFKTFDTIVNVLATCAPEAQAENAIALQERMNLVYRNFISSPKDALTESLEVADIITAYRQRVLEDEERARRVPVLDCKGNFRFV